MNMSFVRNAAGDDGGALSMMFDNFYMTISDSTFHSNTAEAAGNDCSQRVSHSYVNDFVTAHF
jgi:hypothetical protein